MNFMSFFVILSSIAQTGSFLSEGGGYQFIILLVFFIFLSFVIIMVSSNNILIVFICFEFLFLPTMYFVHKLGYSKKIDKANEILFY